MRTQPHSPLSPAHTHLLMYQLMEEQQVVCQCVCLLTWSAPPRVEGGREPVSCKGRPILLQVLAQLGRGDRHTLTPNRSGAVIACHISPHRTHLILTLQAGNRHAPGPVQHTPPTQCSTHMHTTHSCFVVVQVWSVVRLSVLLLHQEAVHSPYLTAALHSCRLDQPPPTAFVNADRARCKVSASWPPRKNDDMYALPRAAANAAALALAHTHTRTHYPPQDWPSFTSSCTACSAYFTLCLVLSICCVVPGSSR